MDKWKYEFSEGNAIFYCDAKFRGRILMGNEIPRKKRKELASILLRIINSYIKDKDND